MSRWRRQLNQRHRHNRRAITSVLLEQLEMAKEIAALMGDRGIDDIIADAVSSERLWSGLSEFIYAVKREKGPKRT